MKFYVISGRSGSGKSTALHVLEDLGFYCVDNLPLALLPALALEIQRQKTRHYAEIAIGVDARNLDAENLTDLGKTRDNITRLGVEMTIIYLDASDHTLIKRFSETRRKHPIAIEAGSLTQAVDLERKLLEPVLDVADLCIDTSNLTIQKLRERIRIEVIQDNAFQAMHILLQSFGFKQGIPSDSDFVFDIRCLPNPHWISHLRPLTGQDKPVIEFLDKQSAVEKMFKDIYTYLVNWMDGFEKNNRSHMTISVGCTGGQHRSVYLVERLWSALLERFPGIQKRHREIQ